jgi:hypothetical protein
MTDVAIVDGKLIVEPRGLNKVWSFRRRLEIPLGHVRAATADPQIGRERSLALRMGGTYVPGVIKAGTFVQGGERSFWNMRNPDKVVVIELRDEPYAWLAIEVADPRAVVQAIYKAGRA